MCVEAMAEDYGGNPHISVLYFDVVTWDGNGILVKNSDWSPCVTSTLLINFADKTITATDALKNLDDKMKKTCAFNGLDETRSSTFVLEGTERWEKEQWKTVRASDK